MKKGSHPFFLSWSPMPQKIAQERMVSLENDETFGATFNHNYTVRYRNSWIHATALPQRLLLQFYENHNTKKKAENAEFLHLDTIKRMFWTSCSRLNSFPELSLERLPQPRVNSGYHFTFAGWGSCTLSRGMWSQWWSWRGLILRPSNNITLSKTYSPYCYRFDSRN